MASLSKSTGCYVIWNILASLFLPALPKQKPFFKAIFSTSRIVQTYKQSYDIAIGPWRSGSATGLVLPSLNDATQIYSLAAKRTSLVRRRWPWYFRLEVLQLVGDPPSRAIDFFKWNNHDLSPKRWGSITSALINWMMIFGCLYHQHLPAPLFFCIKKWWMFGSTKIVTR